MGSKMEKAISKIHRRFPERILSGVNACLKARQGVSATILICCGIDLLSKYFSGSPTSSRQNYINFITKYFPQYSDHKSFYKLIRCGLVHSFNMDRKYIIINSNAQWAQDLNMKLSPKHKMIVVNPWRLRKDLKSAVESFIKDIEQDKTLRKKVRAIYKKFPLEGQTMKIAKFEYITEK